MRRFWTFMVCIGAFLLLLGTFACGETDAHAVSTETPQATATQKPETPAPTPSPSPTPEPTAEVLSVSTPEPTVTPEPSPTPFSFLWISDTQSYTYSDDAGLIAMADYAVRIKDTYNVIAALHSGDFVEYCDLDAEWEMILGDLRPIRETYPFYCVPGNHDLGRGTGKKEVYGYMQYRMYDLCDVRDPERQFNGGECWYTLLEEQGILLLGIGFHMEQDDEKPRNDWLNAVLDAYSAYPAVILTHSFLDNDPYSGVWPTTAGSRLEHSVLSRHPNVRLLLCGHRSGAVRWEQIYEDGRVFTAIMFNMQENRMDGVGACTLLTFYPADRSITVTSYSPYLDIYYPYDGSEQTSFTLENAY